VLKQNEQKIELEWKQKWRFYENDATHDETVSSASWIAPCVSVHWGFRQAGSTSHVKQKFLFKAPDKFQASCSPLSTKNNHCTFDRLTNFDIRFAWDNVCLRNIIMPTLSKIVLKNLLFFGVIVSWQIMNCPNPSKQSYSNASWHYTAFASTQSLWKKWPQEDECLYRTPSPFAAFTCNAVWSARARDPVISGQPLWSTWQLSASKVINFARGQFVVVTQHAVQHWVAASRPQHQIFWILQGLVHAA